MTHWMLTVVIFGGLISGRTFIVVKDGHGEMRLFAFHMVLITF